MKSKSDPAPRALPVREVRGFKGSVVVAHEDGALHAGAIFIQMEVTGIA